MSLLIDTTIIESKIRIEKIDISIKRNGGYVAVTVAQYNSSGGLLRTKTLVHPTPINVLNNLFSNPVTLFNTIDTQVKSKLGISATSEANSDVAFTVNYDEI